VILSLAVYLWAGMVIGRIVVLLRPEFDDGNQKYSDMTSTRMLCVAALFWPMLGLMMLSR